MAASPGERNLKRILILVAAVALLAGCTSESAPPTADRSRRLLTLAAGEAGGIADAQPRLKRQLNLADRQLSQGNPADARRTLAAAQKTLRGTDLAGVPPLIRIAGWVSVSELSRRADDPATANTACDVAVATLRSLDPVVERPEYAVGVANEVRELRGKPAAARLLVESAEWAKPIADVGWRRQALASIADATFDCDDYDGGLAIVRADPDPTWRSDTLADLAGRSVDWASSVGNGAIPGSIPGQGIMGGYRVSPITVTQNRPNRSPATRPFGKAVDYDSVFAGP